MRGPSAAVGDGMCSQAGIAGSSSTSHMGLSSQAKAQLQHFWALSLGLSAITVSLLYHCSSFAGGGCAFRLLSIVLGKQ